VKPRAEKMIVNAGMRASSVALFLYGVALVLIALAIVAFIAVALMVVFA
jgi:hypothetical protein